MGESLEVGDAREQATEALAGFFSEAQIAIFTKGAGDGGPVFGQQAAGSGLLLA